VRDVKAANGFVVARVDASGFVTLGPEPGPTIGRVSTSGEIYDDDAAVHLVGRVSGEGTVIDTEYQTLGKVDAWGHVYDQSGSIVGKVEKPVDAGVLILLATPPEVRAASEPQADTKEGALMSEALDLADEYSKPQVRKDYKPLTDRDLFMERMPRKPEP